MIEPLFIGDQLAHEYIHVTRETADFQYRSIARRGTKDYRQNGNIQSGIISALCYIHLNKPSQAENMFVDLTNKIKPDPQNHLSKNLYISYGWLLLLLQRSEEAYRFLVPFKDVLYQQHPTQFNFVLMVLAELELYDELESLYEKFVKFHPDDEHLFTVMLAYYCETMDYISALDLVVKRAKSLGFDELNLSNYKLVLSETAETLLSPIKTSLTEIEESYLHETEQIVKMFLEYSIEEVVFELSIVVNGQTFIAKVQREYEGGFSAKVEELEGCYTQGDDLEELKEMLIEVISLCLERAA